MPYPQIIVTGDSIAQGSFAVGGYGAKLAEEFAGKADVLNRGMGGWNSRQLVQYLKSDMDLNHSADIQLFVVHIGTNDCNTDSVQTVSVEDYTKNLQTFISYINETWPQAGIVFLSPSLTDFNSMKKFQDTMQIPEQFRNPRSDEHTKKYVEAGKTVAERGKVEVIDVFAIHEKAVASGTKLADLLPDGIHYTSLAYSLIYEDLKRAIKSVNPSLQVENMTEAFPFFSTYANGDDPRGLALAQMKDDFVKKMRELAAVKAE